MLHTKLKEYRAKYNMSQGDLAFLVNVRRETIGNLENGKYNPSLKLALDIAKIFETTVEELFYFSDDTET
ncbi:MAG: helix-turn-helix transcriptional regulator [Blautia sp.]|nr:helix-turn-helix transcriptional regulator [Blautia sp.]